MCIYLFVDFVAALASAANPTNAFFERIRIRVFHENEKILPIMVDSAKKEKRIRHVKRSIIVLHLFIRS